MCQKVKLNLQKKYSKENLIENKVCLLLSFYYYYKYSVSIFKWDTMMTLKEQKEQLVNLNKKLQSCEDQLSLLLDLIYKFPQQQRQRFYDRIQLLRQNLTQLKITVKDNQSTPSLPFATLDKRYQQIFMKINELKSEINSTDAFLPNKKNKKLTNQANVSPLFGQASGVHQSSVKLSKANGKSEYEAIMQTIVQKDEQAKHYKQQAEQYKKLLKQYQYRQFQSMKLAQQLQKQLQQIQQLNHQTEQKSISFQQKSQDLTLKNQTLEILSTEYKMNAQENKKEVQRLNLVLQQSYIKYEGKRIEVEKFAAELAAFQEKYKYDVKMYLEAEDRYKAKERNYEIVLKAKQKQLENKADFQTKNKQLLIENIRIKQDIKIIEAELIVKQQQLFQKSKKIQTSKIQISSLKQKIEQYENELQKRQQKIKQLFVIESENQNIILILERKSKQLEKIVAEIEEQKLLANKKVKKLEEDLNKNVKRLSELSQKFYMIEVDLKKKQENLQRTTSQKQKLQKQVEKFGLESAKSEKKLEEVNRIMKKLQQERNQLKIGIEQKQRNMKKKDEDCKNHERQIQILKKRLLRAKIESIHNLRQILV